MVEVLGHCGECHTPRGLPGAMELDKRLTGGILNGYLAPSLLATDLAARGWNEQDLATFLKHGMSAQGTMFNEMFPVFHNSTQGLSDTDLAAMATQLGRELRGTIHAVFIAYWSAWATPSPP